MKKVLNLRQREGYWDVYYLDNGGTTYQRFFSIESAADFMISNGLTDKTIDETLIALYTSDQNIAVFDGDKLSHLLRD